MYLELTVYILVPLTQFKKDRFVTYPFFCFFGRVNGFLILDFNQ